MWKRILVLAALMLICHEEVLADGGFIAPEGFFMYEPVQRAFIDYDHESGTENLTILPKFHGDALAFAWVVPVPGLPEVALADLQLFRDLDMLTQPDYRSRDGDWDCFGGPGGPDYLIADGGFEVIGSSLVGYYQTMILAATEAPALLDFLTALGFLHDGNREAATAAINDYVDRSWYFVTMQVDSTALAEINPYFHDRPGPYWGNLDPIQLTFASDDIIYPMKISALSASDVTEVYLYVNADHRLTFAGADTYYANRFTSVDYHKAARLPYLREVIREGDFLTKLHCRLGPAQMTRDIVLEPAATDDEIQLILYSGFPWTGLLLLGVPLAAAAKRRFWVGRG